MKKVINITLGSIVFAIDEDAYGALAVYLEQIKNNLKQGDDSKEIILNEKIRATLADRVILQRFEKGGMDPVPTSPEETTAYLKSEQVKWGKVIKERNIQAK
jgi:hypothetical protein